MSISGVEAVLPALEEPDTGLWSWALPSVYCLGVNDEIMQSFSTQLLPLVKVVILPAVLGILTQRRNLTKDWKIIWLQWNSELKVQKKPLILDSLLFSCSDMKHFGRIPVSIHWSEGAYLFCIALHKREITGRVYGYLRGECFKAEEHFLA